MAQIQNNKPGFGAKKILLRLLRAALIIAPFVWIYAGADAKTLMGALASVNVPLLLLILALIYICIVLQGIKWWVLIRRFVPELKMGRAVSVHLESTFYAIAMPSGVAQDVVKSVILSKSHSPSAVWAASWLGRLIGLFSMLLFSFFGIMHLESDILPSGFRTSFFVAAAVIAALGAASFSKKFTRPVRAVAAKAISPRVMANIQKLREGIYVFKYERMALAQTFIISFVTQFIIFFNTSLIIYVISGKFYFMECFAFAPLVEIIAITLPLTPGGIGIREALMALLFTRLGFSGEQIALYVTINLLGSMVRILGGIQPLYRIIVKKTDAKSN